MDCANRTLVAGDLLSSREEVSLKNLIDMKEALLFSQLYADTRTGDTTRFEVPKRWCKYYDDAMFRAHWTLVESHDYAFQPLNSATISLDVLMDTYLLKRLSSPQSNELSTLWACLVELPETDPAGRQLQQYALKVPDSVTGAATFALQVSVLEAPTQLASLFMTFTTTEVMASHPFGQTFSGRHIVGDINAYFSRRTWDAEKYQTVRESIRDFLNGRQHSLIVPIACEVPDGIAQR